MCPWVIFSGSFWSASCLHSVYVVFAHNLHNRQMWSPSAGAHVIKLRDCRLSGTSGVWRTGCHQVSLGTGESDDISDRTGRPTRSQELLPGA